MDTFVGQQHVQDKRGVAIRQNVYITDLIKGMVIKVPKTGLPSVSR